MWESDMHTSTVYRLTLHPTPMWESDMHTSTVYRQNKSQELHGKLEGIELSLEISHVSFPFFDACLFRGLFVKQCRVEETLSFVS